MNLYLLTRTDDWGYDEYDSGVVASKSADDAQKMQNWTAPENISVRLIGTADHSITEGEVIIQSFNAG